MRLLGPRRFDPKCVKALNWLTDEARAQLVISSTWRFMPGLHDIFISEGVTGFMLDRTPDLSASYPATYTRGREIGAWLAEHGRCPFVILDDDADMGEFADRLVRANFEDGLTMPLAERALEILRAAVPE